MRYWALILGASSGIGAACAKELAKNGFNIYGIYLRKPKSVIQELMDEISNYGVDVQFKKMNALDGEQRDIVIENLKSMGIVKCFIHSLDFGTLKPMISSNKDTSSSLIGYTLSGFKLVLIITKSFVLSMNKTLTSISLPL